MKHFTKVCAAASVVLSSYGAFASVCPAAENLGAGLSEGTGYTAEYPTVGSISSPRGYDDTIAFLVGGNYNAPRAAEIEGKAVVLGDFIIGSEGTNSIGKAGVGSGIIPSFGTTYLQVGGNIDGGKTDGETWFPAGASVEYGGTCISSPLNKRAGSGYPDEKACGSMFIPDVQDAGGPGNWLHTFRKQNLDTAPFEAIFADLQVRSEFWYNLQPNGIIYRQNQADWDQNWYFTAGDDSCLQVFHIDYDMLSTLRSRHWGDLRFDQNLKGKTILLNVSPYDNNNNLLSEVYVNGITVFHDGDGMTDKAFSPAMKSSMLWNFYKTPKVVLGPKGGTTDSQHQFQGSVIVPYGDLDMHLVGQDGRLIVKGDVLHDKPGSEFHNYEFDPPCNLPLPPDYVPPPMYCENPTQPTTGATTQATTQAATTAPPTGYCSWWDCATGPDENNTWCNANESNCMGGCNGKFWCTPNKEGGGSGDPHIKRWNRKSFQFHGECDLVLVHSDHVNGNKNLDVHIRTTIVKHWSQIESAALKVGDVVVQVDMDKIFVNGERFSDDDLPITTEEFVVTEPIREETDRTYVIVLTDHSTVTFKIVDKFMNVFVSGNEKDFGQATGLMGDFYKGKPYNRQGERMYDLEKFSFEWQVNHQTDPVLFVDQREPQLPQNKCRMPTEVKTSRHLRASLDRKFVSAAEEACATRSEVDACISDVLNTGSLALARVW